MQKQDLIEGLKDRERLFINLYQKAFPAFARFVRRMGGELDDAKDIFQDALLAWYEKSVSSNLTITKSEPAYLLGVAKYLWIKRYKKSLNEVSLLADMEFDGIIENPLNLSEPKLLRFLESAGQKCMNLLKSFYYDKLSPATLAKQYGFSGERSATAQKYKCLEKVRNEVKQKSLSYADFID
jgi:DNA-directed RNA polymerase specialized sigma24 family protein